MTIKYMVIGVGILLISQIGPRDLDADEEFQVLKLALGLANSHPGLLGY
jgi:hypothetical protein